MDNQRQWNFASLHKLNVTTQTILAWTKTCVLWSPGQASNCEAEYHAQTYDPKEQWESSVGREILSIAITERKNLTSLQTANYARAQLNKLRYQ
jgi:hypothetical protein